MTAVPAEKLTSVDEAIAGVVADIEKFESLVAESKKVLMHLWVKKLGVEIGDTISFSMRSGKGVVRTEGVIGSIETFADHNAWIKVHPLTKLGVPSKATRTIIDRKFVLVRKAGEVAPVVPASTEGTVTPIKKARTRKMSAVDGGITNEQAKDMGLTGPGPEVDRGP
jgi:hypothetical protein